MNSKFEAITAKLPKTMTEDYFYEPLKWIIVLDLLEKGIFRDIICSVLSIGPNLVSKIKGEKYGNRKHVRK